MAYPDFVGPPCGHYASYTFYKGIKFYKKGKMRVINLGEFFFVRISANHDPCIGELELLWNESNNENRLSSVRLYFLPEQTPQGRLSAHGQDEVLMASDKVVLRLEDLVGWITEQVEWSHGLLACSPEPEEPGPGEELPVLQPGRGEEPPAGPESPPALADESDGPLPKLCEENDSTIDQDEVSDILRDKNELRVVVFPYPTYCRYRSILKRLEGKTSSWIRNVLVVALGGSTTVGKNTYILFCRDTFDHEELAHHELNCEYLAPTLKVKRRRKKGKNARSTSPGSESNTSEESKDALVKNNELNNGFKQPPCKTEQEFLQRLYKFMKKRKTPIHRVPHLGFKQIDLFVFFSFAQKLGGYDKITGKRLWKHVYDVLGGDPGSTSAATCTRRHYEKLLLPFERFMDGKEYKPKQSRKQARPQKKPKEEDEEDGEVLDKSGSAVKGESEDAYAFTDSNHENSKDSLLNEEPQSGEDMQMPDNYSDDDSKSIWSIQKSVDGKEEDQEKNGNKAIKPLIIQKEHNESFSEKERKWNEIRRKNALARKWVRQLRPSRGGKISGTEKFAATEKEQPPTPQKPGHPTVQDIVKQEVSPIVPNNINDSIKLPTATPKVKQEYLEPSNGDSGIVSRLQEKLKPMIPEGDRRLGYCNKVSFYNKPTEPYLSSKGSQVQPKIESQTPDKKSWCGYSRDGVYQVAPAPERYPYGCGFEMSMIHSFMKQDYKPGGAQPESSASKPYLMCGNSSESSALSSAEQDANCEAKHHLSQRRPSVIQHTEYVTSPSPSQSPKQLNSEAYSEQLSHDMQFSFGSNVKLSSNVANHLAHSMTGKVSEWLSKGVPEAVACKTPCVVSEKTGELHDKVLMPSSSKTPGPGTGKVPIYGSKSRMEPYAYAGTTKPVRDKGSVNYQNSVAHDTKKVAGYMTNPASKVTPPYQKTFHVNAAAVNSLNPYVKPATKPEQTFAVGSKNKLYVAEPAYSQPKRHRINTVPLASPLPPRPSMLPFTRQQTYRTSPLSDIPKVTGNVQNDCSNEVLDLSVKKKPPAPSAKPLPLHNNIEQSADGCLDLSLKKKVNNNISRESAIENITPPLPQPPSSHSSKPLKPLPTLLTLHEVLEANRQKSSSSSKPAAIGCSPQPSIPISSPAIPSNSAAYAGSAQNKIPPNFITQLPEAAFTKEMAKNLYLTPDPSQFSPYVIPPFYTPNWSATGNMPSVNPSTTTASPNIFKEAMTHGVFPKQYMYNFKQQFHPLLCKDNGCYPPSCK